MGIPSTVCVRGPSQRGLTSYCVRFFFIFPRSGIKTFSTGTASGAHIACLGFPLDLGLALLPLGLDLRIFTSHARRLLHVDIGMDRHQEHLRVAIRVRPCHVRDAKGRELEERMAALVNNSGPFNAVFGPASSQHAVYSVCGSQLLHGALDQGLSGCMFAFGSTGSGKTYSMIGASGGQSRDVLDGVIPQLTDDLFIRAARLEADAAAQSLRFVVTASFVEVLEDRAFDLLSSPGGGAVSARKPSLDIRSLGGRVVASGATEVPVSSTGALLLLVAQGAQARATRATGVHDHSSRSHAILTLAIERRWKRAADGATLSRVAQLQLVDLAGGLALCMKNRTRAMSTAPCVRICTHPGAESMARAHAGVADRAGCAVNTGLLVLGRVLEGLAARGAGGGRSSEAAARRLPFRDSTLTRVLETALSGGGSGRTWMLATVSPDPEDVRDSEATLRWAATARRVAVRGDTARVVELAEAHDPMRGDVHDPDAALRRRCISISTVAHGDVFARAAGDPGDPLVLLVHGSGPRNSSLQWNFVVPQLLQQQRPVTAAAAAPEGGGPTGGAGRRGLYLVAIDCPGYGRTPGDRQTIRSHPGAFLSDVVRSLGKAVAYTIAGSSQGAAAVLNAALECPDIAHYVAVVHPVGHAPRRYTAILQPTLLMFDVDDDGHPVRVGRLMRQYLPRPHYSEWSGRAEPGYLQARFADALRGMWAAYPEPPHADGRTGLPDMARLAGGLHAWATATGDEESHGEDDIAGGGVHADLISRGKAGGAADARGADPGYGRPSVDEADSEPGSGSTAAERPSPWRVEVDDATGSVSYVNLRTRERASARPADFVPPRLERAPVVMAAAGAGAAATAASLAAPLTVHAAARRAVDEAALAAAAVEALLSTHACSRCTRVLAEPRVLRPCGHVQCGACAYRFAKVCGRCALCGASVARTEAASAAHVARIAARIATGELSAAEFEAQATLAVQFAPLASSAAGPGPALPNPIVLEFGNTASPPGPEDPRTRRAMRTFLRVLSPGHAGAVRSVAFDVNPGAAHRVAPLERPPFECERSMARPLPCFITVEFAAALRLPPLLLQYYTQHTSERIARRAVIQPQQQLGPTAPRRRAGGRPDPVVVDVTDFADVWVTVMEEGFAVVEKNIVRVT